MTLYCEGSGKQLTVSDASKLNKIASRKNFATEVKQIMGYYSSDRSNLRNVTTLVSHLGRFFDILP